MWGLRCEPTLRISEPRTRWSRIAHKGIDYRQPSDVASSQERTLKIFSPIYIVNDYVPTQYRLSMKIDACGSAWDARKSVIQITLNSNA